MTMTAINLSGTVVLVGALFELNWQIVVGSLLGIWGFRIALWIGEKIDRERLCDK